MNQEIKSYYNQFFGGGSRGSLVSILFYKIRPPWPIRGGFKVFGGGGGGGGGDYMSNV